MTLDTFQRKFHLTPRQRQVGELIASGASRKEIAAKLDITVYTVAFHQVNIRHKLGAMTSTRVADSVFRRLT